MRKFKAFVFITVLIAFAIGLGILSSQFIKPFFVRQGLNQNWAWPVICLAFAVVFSAKTRTPLSISGGGIKNAVIRFATGIGAGIGLQVAFYLLHQRRAFEFQGLASAPLLFQTMVSFSEEVLFRGSFQAHLAKIFGRTLSSQMAAAVLISLPFAAIHGANPILFSHGGFDTGWFAGTFFLSLLAGLAYAFTKKVDTAFGVHLGHNVIAIFF